MATLTQRAIIDALLKLLEERRFDKITVKDIADYCGINRNTFYYHFEDTRSVLKAVLRNESERVFADYSDPDTWQDGFIAAANFALCNRKVVLNLYDSLSRDELEKYIKDIAGEVMIRYISKVTEGYNIDPKERELVCQFYTCGLVGITTEWIEQGMADNPEEKIYKLGALLEGNIVASLCHK